METFEQIVRAKMEEIEEYPIDTQENEELYIHQLNVLQEAFHILFGKDMIGFRCKQDFANEES